MARVEQFPEPVVRAAPSRKIFPIGALVRSLGTKLVLLLIVFVTVPIILYSEFRQADAEKRRLLLDSVRAQGRLIAEALRPLVERDNPSPLPELNQTIKPLATSQLGIKVLFRPHSEPGLDGFFFVASEPPVPEATLDAQRDELIKRGVFGKLAQSCEIQVPIAVRHREANGPEELLSSITPVTTPAGCWAVVTTHSSRGMLGTAIDQPYWRTVEVRVAASIYMGMAVFTFGLFLAIWRGLRRFRNMARSIGEGRLEAPGFAAQNEVPELAVVAEEFDRMTGALRDSADSIRRAAEDNAHAFKTPIAIMRQSLEPVKRVVPEDHPRGRRALHVIEESIDRLDHLVTSARRLDQATAELLDPARERINLSGLLDRMLAAYADSFTGRGLVLARHIEPNLIVRAGQDLIETVVENLVDNAVEASPHGGEIAVELKRQRTWTSLTVSDRGPGVKQDDLDRIFERYVSLRPSEQTPDAEKAHSGIGLWIVRRNVQAMGGHVRAENRSDGGFSVIVRLPLAPSAKARPV